MRFGKGKGYNSACPAIAMPIAKACAANKVQYFHATVIIIILLTNDLCTIHGLCRIERKKNLTTDNFVQLKRNAT